MSELKSLDVRIGKSIERHEKAQKTKALAKLKATAKSMGYQLGELVANSPAKSNAKAKPKAKTPPLPVAYRDPTNAENIWVGRGPRPGWLKDALTAGKALEDFRV